MINFTKKKQIHILIVLGILITSFSLISSKKENDYDGNINIDGIQELGEFDETINKNNTKGQDSINKVKANGYKYTEVAETIAVHIKGAVNNPGIVNAKQGERLIDIIDKAGGLNSEADLDRINLALKVEDEDFIHIPVIGEVQLDAGEANIVEASEVTSSTGKNSDLININTADKEELKTLSGVGDSTADKIIQYRDENKFKAIEDIMEVSGIGEKKFEAIREFITVR